MFGCAMRMYIEHQEQCIKREVRQLSLALVILVVIWGILQPMPFFVKCAFTVISGCMAFESVFLLHSYRKSKGG